MTLPAAALHCSTGPWNIAATNGKGVPPSAKSESQRLSRSMRNVMSLAIEKIIDISLELDPKNFGMRTPAGFKKDMQFEMETLKEHDAPGGAGQIVRGVHMRLHAGSHVVRPSTTCGAELRFISFRSNSSSVTPSSPTCATRCRAKRSPRTISSAP